MLCDDATTAPNDSASSRDSVSDDRHSSRSSQASIKSEYRVPRQFPSTTLDASNRQQQPDMLMTRSATADGLRREASPPATPDDSSSEYKASFREFDKYVYVDDVHGFRPRQQQETTPGQTWLDQVNERHGQAIVFAKRSYAGHPITGNGS